MSVVLRGPPDVRWGGLPSAEVLNEQRVAGFVALFVAYTVILAMGRRSSMVRWMLRRGGAIFAGGILIGIAVFSLLRPNHMMANMRSLIVNLLCHDPFGWGRTAAACLVIAPLVTRLKRFPHSGLFGGFIVGYCLIVFCLGFLRNNPYRTGAFDSANRMLLTLFPVVLCYLTLKIGALIARIDDPADRIRQT